LRITGNGLDTDKKLSATEVKTITDYMKNDLRAADEDGYDEFAEMPLDHEVEIIEEVVPEEESLADTVYEEEEVLAHVQEYILRRGYYFEKEVLYNYHISLKTRPFVILAGLSGTGKSKLSQLYAEALGHKAHYLRLAVRPNWDDDRYLLGHFNTITGTYVTETALDFILEANKQSHNLFFFCLDEMNLAHIEYYFSQFLSALEEEKPEDRLIPLLSRSIQQDMRNPNAVPAQLPLPENLLFTGTVNIDETTQSISDKVIDRANTLEFFQIDLGKLPDKDSQAIPQPLFISAANWQLFQVTKPDKTFRSQIIELNSILNTVNMGIGFRVLHEIELYIANSQGLLAPEVALDLQVKQRILPHIRGTVLIDKALEKLITFTKRHHLSSSEQRLIEMKNRLKENGYTSFWH
jgi:energy-coupling factor transporter ATP-binding protein EcfA2